MIEFVIFVGGFIFGMAFMWFIAIDVIEGAIEIDRKHIKCLERELKEARS